MTKTSGLGVGLPRTDISQPEVFVSHANACLTPNGRLRLAQLIVDKGLAATPGRGTMELLGHHRAPLADRYRELGRNGMADRSSRPHRSPRQTPSRRERRGIGLRVSRRWGPARIAYLLGMTVSTVHKILSRYGSHP
jgi:leucine-zipper of insertion element IS481